MKARPIIGPKTRFLTILVSLSFLVSGCTQSFIEWPIDTGKSANPIPASTAGNSVKNDPGISQFTILTSGDILLHERTWNQAKQDGSESDWDFFPQFSDIAPLTESVDLALCHLETPIANKNENYSGYPIFNSPPEIIGTIKKLGFDMCSTASNHSLDKGFTGIERTLTKLDEVEIAHTGTARSLGESKTPLIVEIQSGDQIIKVGILSYTYGFNGLIRDKDKPWSANLIDFDSIVSEATFARDLGAQFVIAKLHWGTEYTNKANEYQIE